MRGSRLLEAALCSPRGSRRGDGCLAEGEQVREEALRAGHAGGDLAVERVAAVDESAAPEARREEPARERLLSGVMACERRLVLRVPGAREVEPAEVHPAVEVGGLDP